MGGTEIYQPLLEIFKLQKQRKNPKIETLIYLLTDGAVSDSNAVINLISQNCS